MQSILLLFIINRFCLYNYYVKTEIYKQKVVAVWLLGKLMQTLCIKVFICFDVDLFYIEILIFYIY